jgi:NodT family efflux transporter outer membrane factor (OMF) lipoprotein
MSRRVHPLLLLTALSPLAGCMVGPNYVKPKAEIAPAYKEDAGWKVAQPQDQLPRGNWWELFGDPQLNALEEQVNVSNQTVQLSLAQYRQARAVVQEARSALFPTLSLNPEVTRAKASNTLGAQPAAHGAITLYQVPVDASWTVDLWGQYRRGYESTEASAQASAAQLETTRLAMQAELAQDYFLLRTLDSQKMLLEGTAVNYQKTLDLTKNRYAAGVVSKADVAAAETLLSSTQAQAIAVGVQRAQTEHAIAMLIGKPAPLFSLPAMPLPSTIVPPDIPAGVPSALLERRPDIAAAERSVAAANAQIGVAIAGYYPTLTLSGALGFSTTSSFASCCSQLFTYPSRFWSLGAQMAQPLFNGFLTRAQVDAARAGYDGTVANYRQAVLTGFQEVEDNLAALRILEQEAKVQNTAVASAQQSVQLFLNQYKAGTISYLDVVVVQDTLLSNEVTAVTILGSRMTAAVALVKALGGGWQATDLPTPDDLAKRENLAHGPDTTPPTTAAANQPAAAHPTQ